jgi:hypothetical protein
LPEVADETRINVRQFSQSLRPPPATFAMAQALVIDVVPWRMQTAPCLQNELKLISFSALCISECRADMGTPVTTSERVGRTMEASASARGDTAMMNNGLSQGSATIYQFPVGGRAALAGRHYGETRLPADRLSLPVNETICSGSWYHQEAVDEAKPKWDR